MKKLGIETIMLMLIIALAVSSVSAQSPRKLRGKERKEFAKVMGNYRVIILGRDSMLNLRPVNDSIKVSFRVKGTKVVVSFSTLLEKANDEVKMYLNERDKYQQSTPRFMIFSALEAFLRTPPRAFAELELPDSVDENLNFVKEQILEAFIEKGELEIYNKESIKQEYIILRQYYCGKYVGCSQCIMMGMLYFLEGEKMFFLESTRLIS